MPAPVLRRPVETRAVADFLTSASVEPSGLVVEGEAGIGKTTLWVAAVDQADEQGFRVLSARPSAAESVLAYISLADMLSEVEPEAWAELPDPQRLAIDRMLLRATSDGQATDQRAVAAAFLSVVKGLEVETPVLLAIDDLQWLDASSTQIIGFAARRLSGPVGVLGTVRSDPDCTDAAWWLQLPRLDAVQRIGLGPLSLGGLREVIAERLGRQMSRRAMVRIHEISRGNPFYALELARVMDERTPSSEVSLPNTLAELVRARIGSLTPDVHNVLLAASCVAAPTVELVARATDSDAEGVVALLVDAEDKGIVQIDGHRLDFTHPLLARGVYAVATPAQRREMHRRLAEIVDDPERRARHLAMAVAWGDEHTLACLDGAAEIARKRGAPAAAAELLDLAIGLGGDSPERRIRSASHYFNAGDNVRARVLLEGTIGDLPNGPLRAEALSLLASLSMAVGNFLDAAEVLNRALGERDDNLAVRVQWMVMRSFALLNVEPTRRRGAHRRGRRFSCDAAGPTALAQPGAGHARTAAILGWRGPRSGLSATRTRPRGLRCRRRPRVATQHVQRRAARVDRTTRSGLRGAAIDSAALHRARRGERDDAPGGDLRSDRNLARELHRSNRDSPRTPWIELFNWAMIWHSLSARAVRSRAAPRTPAVSTGPVSTSARHSPRASVAPTSITFCGCGSSPPLVFSKFRWVITTPRPPHSNRCCLPSTQSRTGPKSSSLRSFPMPPRPSSTRIGLNRRSHWSMRSKAMADGLTGHGCWQSLPVVEPCCWLPGESSTLRWAPRRRRCPNMSDYRCRSNAPAPSCCSACCSADCDAGMRPSPTLREALGAFETLGTPLWADRARAELDRTIAGHGSAGELTVSEQRIAELAASGMTNQDVAAAMFVSPKTVEANLARIYRKLGIHSRAELGRMVGQHRNIGKHPMRPAGADL